MQDDKKNPYDLSERLLLFGKRMLEICKMLPSYPECNRIRSQLSGCGTSVRANYEEADGAITKKDIVNKAEVLNGISLEFRNWVLF